MPPAPPLVRQHQAKGSAAPSHASPLLLPGLQGPGSNRRGVLGAHGDLYEDYYELHEQWVARGLPYGDEVGSLLGPDKPRPTLVPAQHVGVGWPGGRND